MSRCAMPKCAFPAAFRRISDQRLFCSEHAGYSLIIGPIVDKYLESRGFSPGPRSDWALERFPPEIGETSPGKETR